MMRLFVNRWIVSLALCFVSLSLFAQEKTLQYYNSHESEILPDARAAFQKGDYNRTMELCRWHYIIYGDNATVEALRDRSQRCAQLSKEMDDLRSEGNVKDAKQKANAILSINPDDAAAKEVLAIEEPIFPVQDTVVVEPPAIPEDEVVAPPIETQMNEAEDDQKLEQIQSPFEDVTSSSASRPEQSQPYEPRTRFVVKAGATIIDLKQFSQTIAPGVSVGAYDLGGSPVGGEIGAYICPGLSAVSASLLGVDASLVFRVANNIYPKLCVGFFSCKSTEGGVSTTGMCAGAGLTFMVGGHFCLEIGAKYYPKVSIQGTEMVSTTPGASYEFPAAKQVLAGGIAPFVSLGWAF